MNNSIKALLICVIFLALLITGMVLLLSNLPHITNSDPDIASKSKKHAIIGAILIGLALVVGIGLLFYGIRSANRLPPYQLRMMQL